MSNNIKDKILKLEKENALIKQKIAQDRMRLNSGKPNYVDFATPIDQLIVKFK